MTTERKEDRAHEIVCYDGAYHAGAVDYPTANAIVRQLDQLFSCGPHAVRASRPSPAERDREDAQKAMRQLSGFVTEMRDAGWDATADELEGALGLLEKFIAASRVSGASDA